MLTSRERTIRALNHLPVDRAPRDLWKLYGIVMMRHDEFEEMNRRFDFDVVTAPVRYGKGERVSGGYCEVGQYTDAWGCVWHVGERGVSGEVKGPPLSDWAALAHYQPPWEVLKNADMGEVGRFCASTTKFVRAPTLVNPFERLQYLRGTENVYIDLAYGTKEIFSLLEMIHDFNCRNMKLVAETDADAVQFMDDWGGQKSTLIAPRMWRQVFKPLYREYCDILRAKGKYILYHSDGFIEPLYPDLIDLGIHALNSQLFCMDIEELGRRYGGKITFWGEIDRQWALPFGTPWDVRAAVRRVRAALDAGKGGVVAQCCWGLKDPAENVAAVYEEWEKPLGAGD